MTLGTLVVILAFTAVVFLVFGTCGAILTRRLWAPFPALAWAYGAGAVAMVGWLEFVVTWLHRQAGPAVGAGLFGVAVAVVVISRPWRWIDKIWPLLAITAGILAAYVGLLYLWGAGYGNPFYLAANRFKSLPASDNFLPTLSADVTGAGENPTDFYGSWNVGDRPTLQAGLVLLLRSIFPIIPINPYLVGFAVSMMAQLLWVPGLVVLLRSIGFTMRTALVTVVFVAATGTMIFNTVYTWPKLLSAALVLAALGCLIVGLRGRLTGRVALPSAAVFFALGMLSHGAAIYALPAIAVLGVILLVRSSRRLLGALLTVAVTASTYVPWMLYQHVTSPPGDRLLKWHLAGVTQVNNRGFLETLTAAYAALTWPHWLEARWANLKTIFHIGVWLPFDGSKVSVLAVRDDEFYRTSNALSWGLVAMAAALAIALIARTRGSRLTGPRRWVLWLWGLMALCLLFWVVAEFSPGSTVVHQGSHVWIIIFIAGGFAWLRSYSRLAAWVLLAAQVASTAFYYVPSFWSTATFSPTLSHRALILALGGMVLCALALVLSWQPGWRRWHSLRIRRASDRGAQTHEEVPQSG